MTKELQGYTIDCIETEVSDYFNGIILHVYLFPDTMGIRAELNRDLLEEWYYEELLGVSIEDWHYSIRKDKAKLQDIWERTPADMLEFYEP